MVNDFDIEEEEVAIENKEEFLMKIEKRVRNLFPKIKSEKASHTQSD